MESPVVLHVEYRAVEMLVVSSLRPGVRLLGDSVLWLNSEK